MWEGRDGLFILDMGHLWLNVHLIYVKLLKDGLLAEGGFWKSFFFFLSYSHIHLIGRAFSSMNLEKNVCHIWMSDDDLSLEFIV